MMKVYIAAPFSELPFAAKIAVGLTQAADIICTARWLTEHSEMTAEWAQRDLDDIDAADVLVALNAATWNEPAANKGSGGRHVELGYALARGKPIVLVGVRSNIFHSHPAVRLISWHDAMNLPAILLDVFETVCP